MAKIYYDKDCNLKLLEGKTVGIVGYGSQGHAHAQNLRDSGCQVIVGEAKGTPGWKNAQKAGFKVMNAAEMAKEADIIVMLAPDNLHRTIYYGEIEKGLTKGKMLMFAHGFNIHYGQVLPPTNIDVTMIAPKCPGHMLRQLYSEGAGSPAIVAVHQDATGKALATALAYAEGIGCGRAGVIETTFAEETLIEAGYQPEIAYFEVCNELKLIIDLIYQGGLSYMRYSISDTAEYGDYTRGPRVIDEMVKEEMMTILGEIQDGSFAKEWILENQAGRPVYNALKRMDEEHPLELVGRELREMMPWLKKK
jgi:ketol-acid reductoisomerase